MPSSLLKSPPAPRCEHTLDGLDLFSALSPEAREGLERRLSALSLGRGEILVREGDGADALYVVVSGRFAVLKAGRAAAIAEIGAGQPVGEIAFLNGGTRTATVVALRDSLVLRLGREDFDALVDEHPCVWRSLTTTLVSRLAETTTALPPAPDPRPRTIAIIRAGAGPVPDGFVERLAAVMRQVARTTLVTRADFERLAGANAATSAETATRALNDLERQNDYLLLIADAEPSPWSEKALRHADLVLAVADFATDPAPNALEALACGLVAPEARRLALVHPQRTRIVGTRHWLDPRAVGMHHHLALDDADDIARLFRFISGTARGFVACGGGALAPTHIGLYRALSEAGHRFDMLGGTSAGSAMTAAFILGTPPLEIDRGVHEMFVERRAMRRLTVPRFALLDHATFDAELKRLYGEGDIEDMWLPYFAVSTNLSSYRLEVHRRGPLWAAIRASAAIPVLLPPYYTESGDMLVDGGILDNVPVRVMHELKSGPNVVVSFMLPEHERFAVSYEALPSRAELMRLALMPLRRGRTPQAPHLVTVLMRSLMANRNDFKRHLTDEDLLLVPPIPADVGLLDWHRHSELMERAYSWGREELLRRAALTA